MNSTSRPLDTLTDLTREARDKASLSLAGERRNERQVAEQLDALLRYRLEYAQRLQQAMHTGIDPATMRNYQQFLDSLDDALDRARKALADQQQRVGQQQQQWQTEQRKLSSYDTLNWRRTLQQNRKDQRQEQRTNDDMVGGRLIRERLVTRDK